MKSLLPLAAALVLGALIFYAGVVLAPVGGVPATPAKPKIWDRPELKILVVGDLMFDRQIRSVGERAGEDYLLSCADPLLAEADLVMGNLEGPITDNFSVSQGSVVGSPANYQFTFPPTTAALLARHNFKLVNLGNNHIGNFGWAGIGETKKYLDEAGVNYFGGLAGDSPVYQLDQNGFPLSFVNYNQFGGETAEVVAAQIAAERAAGRIVILYAHWGEEYSPASDYQREWAALFAASGASVIIGSHPHVIQSSELIGGTPVYYSLGNFVFDQYWEPAVRTGLALLLRVSESGITVEEKRVELIPDGRTCPAAKLV
jgi:poly-gamma-glutamate synthesis protein (capsule biosynthesis protein)